MYLMNWTTANILTAATVILLIVIPIIVLAVAFGKKGNDYHDVDNLYEDEDF